MWKYKSQSAVNIFGLAFGVTCFVFGLFWIRYETTYNGFFPDARRMYVMAEKSPIMEFPITGFDNKKLLEQIPEFEQITWHSGEVESYYGYDQRSAYVTSVDVSPDFFDFFKWTFLEGDNAFFREKKGGVVITKQLAIRLFGDEPAVGKTINILRGDNKQPTGNQCVVSGVVKDWPKNCTFKFEAMVCTDANFRAIFFAKVDRHADINTLREKFEQTSIKSLYPGNTDCTWTIKPIGSLHYKYFTDDSMYGVNFILIFFLAGFLGLLSALFNFVTLSSGALLNRSKEAVIHVIMGAERSDLTRLFLINILITVFAAFAISCLTIYVLCPFFERFFFIPTDGILRLGCLIALSGLLVTTLISFIPIARHNRRNIANAFAGGKPVGPKIPLKRLMITLQLTIGCLLMMIAITVFRQITYMKNTDTGIDVNNVIEMQLSWYRSKQIDPATVISQLTVSPYVEQTCITYRYSPFQVTVGDYLPADADSPIKMGRVNVIDSSFFSFFKFNLIKGSFFDSHQTHYCVINQKAAQLIGTEPIGKTITQQINQSIQEWEICGVVQDIYYEFKKEIGPIIYLNEMYVDRQDYSSFLYYARIHPQFHKEGMALLQSVMLGDDEADGSETPCIWLEDRLEKVRKDESAMFLLFSVLAMTCIVISLFGIYSLATLTTRRRRREIAIRKVFGADTVDVVRMILREYLWLVVIAGAVAFPVAFWLMSRWLESYVYHAGVSWWLLSAVIIIVATVVMTTVLGQVLKVTNENPAEVVKSE